MSYKLSVDAFDKTFAVNGDGTKLTHNSGKRFKLFPFITTGNSVKDLSTVIGRYINRINGQEVETLDVGDFIESLKQGTSIKSGQEELFYQVVRHIFFVEVFSSGN